MITLKSSLQLDGGPGHPIHGVLGLALRALRDDLPQFSRLACSMVLPAALSIADAIRRPLRKYPRLVRKCGS